MPDLNGHCAPTVKRDRPDAPPKRQDAQVRTVPARASHQPDTLHSTTGRAKLDRTGWSRNGSDALVKPEQRTTKQRPDALQN
jgi:hypothetical protein